MQSVVIFGGGVILRYNNQVLNCSIQRVLLCVSYFSPTMGRKVGQTAGDRRLFD